MNRRTRLPRIKPKFVPAVDFYKSLGIHFEVGAKLVALGVIQPDATLNDRPIYLADVQTVERAQAAIAQFRVSRARAIDNAKELAHA